MSRQNKTKTELLQELQAMQKRIAELEKTEAALERSQQRFRLFAETSFEGIVFAEDGIFVDVNDQFANMVGYTREELIGQSVMFIVAPESQSQARKAIQTNRLEPYKIFGLHKDGTLLQAEVMARTIQAGGHQLRATAIRDITAQEHTQAALKTSERKFSTAFHTSPDSININRLADGLYLEINQGFTDIMGYEPADVIGKTSLELDIWADPEDRTYLVKGLSERGEVTNLEAKFKLKNGEVGTGLMSARIMQFNNEQCILSVTRDITGRKEDQKQIQRLNQKLLVAYNETLEGWSRALNLRDPNTDAHSKRVVERTLSLAKRIGIPDAELVHIRRGAILHDIGKMGVPDQILLKAGPLTEEEWRIMRMHPIFAYNMLSQIPFLENSVDIPYCHHEKWDGTGYPQGLKNAEIPLSARIFSVVDIFDALTSDRSYRKAWCREDALAFIEKEAGSHFDPDIARLFLEME